MTLHKLFLTVAAPGCAPGAYPTYGAGVQSRDESLFVGGWVA